jgi:hypothetical protein
MNKQKAPKIDSNISRVNFSKKSINNFRTFNTFPCAGTSQVVNIPKINLCVTRVDFVASQFSPFFIRFTTAEKIYKFRTFTRFLWFFFLKNVFLTPFACLCHRCVAHTWVCPGKSEAWLAGPGEKTI